MPVASRGIAERIFMQIDMVYVVLINYFRLVQFRLNSDGSI